jgi:FtsZ-interacting cell division protein YlmF
MYQRLLDFISGAVYLKVAKLVNPEKRIFLVVPKKFSIQFENEENSNSEVLDLRYNEEEEIRPFYE